MYKEQNIRICPCCKNKVNKDEENCPYCGEYLFRHFSRENSITPLVIIIFTILFFISLFILGQKAEILQSLISRNNNSNLNSNPNSILKVSYINKQKTEPEKQQNQEQLFVKYMDNLQKNIKKNWNPPRGDESKRVILLFKLDRQGNLLNVKVKQSSGSKSTDEAAIYAVEKAAPFGQLPIEFTGDSVDIQFTFDYNVFGMKDNKR